MKKQISFPTVQTLEGSRMSQLIWLLYGPWGIGKSTFFSKMKDGNRAPLFFHTADGGLKFIKAYKKPVSGWTDFVEKVNALVENPPNIYSMVCLDTVDVLFRMCRKEICKRRGIEHISDEDWGKGYDMVRDEFEITICKLATLSEHGIGLAFVSHQKEIEIRGRGTRTNKIVPTVPKQAYAIIAPMCDIIAYAGFTMGAADKPDEMGRQIHFEPDETLEAKDRTGLLPKSCALDFDRVRQYLEEGVESETPATKKAAQPQRRKKKKRRA